MNNIYEANSNFDFNSLSLTHPALMNGGTYFTKINCERKNLYIETPKSLTKQGFIKNGKKMYIDLMFSNLDTEFILWMENLESKCQKLIYEKKESWFQNELELDDIEYAFTSPLKVYKSGKFYLLRVNVKMNYSTNLPAVKIYNEYETPLNIDDVNSKTEIISVLEIQGIKFTSKSFQIEIEMKQSMIMNSDEIFDKCLIKNSTSQKTSNIVSPNIVSPNIVSPDFNTSFTDFNQGYTNMTSTSSKNNEFDRNSEPFECDFIKDEKMNEETSLENIEDSHLNKLKNLANSIFQQEIKEKQNSQSNKSIENQTKIQSENQRENQTKNQTENQTENQINTIEENKNTIQIFKENENSNDLQEVNFDDNYDNLETITLKKPNQVYYEIYKVAREKAKKAKKEAIIAFLEAKNIKKTYLLDIDDDSDDSDDSDSDNFHMDE